MTKVLENRFQVVARLKAALSSIRMGYHDPPSMWLKLDICKTTRYFEVLGVKEKLFAPYFGFSIFLFEAGFPDSITNSSFKYKWYAEGIDHVWITSGRLCFFGSRVNSIE